MDRRRRHLAGLLAGVPDAVPPRTGATTPTRTGRCSSCYVGKGVHGVLINGTTGEWFSQTTEERRLVAETAIDAGRRAACRSSSAAPRTPRARRRSSAGTRSRPAPTASSRRRRPTRRRSTDETVAYYEDLASGDRRAAARLQLAARHGRRHRPRARDRLAEIDTVVALKDSTPNAAAVLRDDARRRRPRPRLRAVHVGRGVRAACSRDGGDGFIGGGTLFGAPDPQFWEDYWRGRPRRRAARTPCAPTGCSRSSGCPAAGAGMYGGYQSQLKAIMKMIGQPGGEPRRPRLPVDRPGEPRRDPRRCSSRSRCCPEDGERRMSTSSRGVDHVGVGVGDMDDGDRLLRPGRVLGRALRLHGRRAGDRGFTAGRGARASRCSRTPGRRRSARAGSSSCRCSTATGPPPVPDGQRLGRARRSARSACTCATSRPCTTRLVAAGATSLMAPLEGAVMPNDVSLDIALRRRPVGRQARADRVDRAVEVAARRAARGGREPRRLRRRGHRREPRVLRARWGSARCCSSRPSSSSRWRPGTTGSCPTSTW